MAEGGSRLKLSKLGTVIEWLSPLGDELAEPESEGIWKFPGCAAAASACDSIVPMASYIGLLKSRLPSDVTSFSPNSLFACNRSIYDYYYFCKTKKVVF